MTQKLLWLDIETTGLDPEHHFILEVGLVVTTTELDFVASASGIIANHFMPFQTLYERADHYVQTMHEKSGLWDDIRSAYRQGEGKTHWQSTVITLEYNLLKFIDEHFGTEVKPPMCGSSLAFDRSFLAVSMRALLHRFHYRSIDVSSIKELAALWAPSVYDTRPGQDDADKKHRSVDDCLASVAELRHYVDSDFIRPTRLFEE